MGLGLGLSRVSFIPNRPRAKPLNPLIALKTLKPLKPSNLSSEKLDASTPAHFVGSQRFRAFCVWGFRGLRCRIGQLKSSGVNTFPMMVLEAR